MTLKQKQAIDNYPIIAERRGIYKFLESDGEWKGKYCLVVGANDRKRDRIISILLLSSDGVTNYGRDCVDVPLSTHEARFVRCGMLTYCKRNMIGEKVFQISRHTMACVMQQIKIELGLVDRSHTAPEVEDEVPDYKKMYEGLLDYIADHSIGK